MNTLIREALTSDLDDLIALARATISASYRPFLGDGEVDAFLVGGAADRYVRENLGRCRVILLDGRAVGLAVWRDALVDLMMVHPAAQRRGLGTALLRHVEA